LSVPETGNVLNRKLTGKFLLQGRQPLYTLRYEKTASFKSFKPCNGDGRRKDFSVENLDCAGSGIAYFNRVMFPDEAILNLWYYLNKV
jgi:hypothetical protein